VKRFWKDAALAAQKGGWTVELDGRSVRTPARKPLLLPTEALARAVASEWQDVGETIDPRAMPLTGLANAAIDRVAPDPEDFARGLAKYAEADLACYRAEAPAGLVERQRERWDALLGWARRRFDVEFRTTCGVVHVAQPEFTVGQLTGAVLSLDPFKLAGLSPLVTIGGSLVAALAILERASTPAEAWMAVSIDEHWQLEQWGSDDEAELSLENRKRDFLSAARFLELLEV